MIYLYKSLINANNYAIIGYTRTNNKLITLSDILSSKYVYRELRGWNPKVISTPLQDGNRLIEVLIEGEPNVDFTIIQNILAPANDIERLLAADLSKVIATSQTVELHEEFTAIIGNDYQFLIERVRKPDNILIDKAMTEPDSQVSFSVPSYGELLQVYGDLLKKEEEADTEVYNEDMEDGEQGSDTTNFTDFFSNAETNLLTDFESLNCRINTTTIPVFKQFKYIDSIFYKDILQRFGYPIPFEYVEGNVDNNTLPIQENETIYFNALTALIRDGIAHENDVVTQSEIDTLIEQGVTSTVVNAYLQDVARVAYSINWAHTGTVSTSYDTGDDSSDDEGSENAGSFIVPGYYNVTLENNNPVIISKSPLLAERIQNGNFVDGFSNLVRFVYQNIKNSYAWAECVIKLLRWGKRKPTCIVLENKSNDKPVYFDLNKSVQTSFAKSIHELKPLILDEEGNTMRLTGLIWTGLNSETVSDIEGINNALGLNLPSNFITPIGVTLETKYQEHDDIITSEHLDLFSFVSMIVNKNIKVQGVKFDTESGSFKISVNDLELDTYSLNTVLADTSNDVRRVAIMQSPALVKILTVFMTRIKDIDVKNINVFSILSKMYNMMRFSDCYDVYNIVMQSDPQVRNSDLTNRAKLSGTRKTDLVVQAIIPEVVTPILTLATAIEGGDPRDLTFAEIITIAYKVSKGEVSLTPKAIINPKFKSGVDACQVWMRVLKGEETVAYVGRHTQSIPKQGQVIEKKSFYIWQGEDGPVNKPFKSITIAEFAQTLLATYIKFAKEGKLPIALDNIFFLAQPDVMDNIARMLKGM